MLGQLILYLLLSLSVYAQSTSSDLVRFKEQFKEILVDVRGSRGGRGDVAAGYLTIMELIRKHRVTHTITVLVDEDSRKILDQLAAGNSEFWKQVSVETIDSVAGNKVFDLYLSLASPTSKYRYGNQIDESRDGNSNDAKANQKIKFNSSGVLIIQTVLGNTETTEEGSYALIRSHGINFNLSPAGVSINEAGIYSDYVAVELKNKTGEEIQDFIINEAVQIPDQRTRLLIGSIITGEKLKSSTIGLAYGISHTDTKAQFLSYLQGLTKYPHGSYCIITPSSFDIADIHDSKLQAKVVYVNSEYELPEVAEKGKIYLIQTKALPHKIFVGLLAYSMKKGLVPVGAGDGFMSAAINLGGAFVLTQVPWNAQNIINFKMRLLHVLEEAVPDPRLREVYTRYIKKIFEDINFENAQELKGMTPLFNLLSNRIPSLTTQLIRAALLASQLPALSNEEINQSLDKIMDKTFRESVLARGQRGPIISSPDTISLLKAALKSQLEADSKIGMPVYDNFNKFHLDKKPSKKPNNQITFDEDKLSLLLKEIKIDTTYNNEFYFNKKIKDEFIFYTHKNELKLNDSKKEKAKLPFIPVSCFKSLEKVPSPLY